MKTESKTRIEIRVTDDEYAYIKSNAEDVGLTMSAYMRDRALRGVTIKRGNIEIQRLVWEINKIGVNINQAVHLANQAQFISPHQMEQIMEMLGEVWNLLDKFAEPLSYEWGLHNEHKVKIRAANDD